MKKIMALLLAALLCLSCAAYAQTLDESTLGLRMELDDGIVYETEPLVSGSPIGGVTFTNGETGEYLGILAVLNDALARLYYQNAEVFVDDPDLPHQNGHTYLLQMEDGLTEQSAELAASVESALEQAEFREPEIWNPVGNRVTFDTRNWDGQRVTDEILDGKITMINVWATTCTPCLNEMPELAQMERLLPDNAQILYVCCDVTEPGDAHYADLMNAMAEKSGVTRKNLLLAAPGGMALLLASVSATPTTFFVDENGILLDQIVVGTQPDEYRIIMDELLAN